VTDIGTPHYEGRQGPAQDPEEFPYRVLYSDQVPTPGYLHYPAKSFEAAKAQAWKLAKRDLRPGSGVDMNLIFVQRWDAAENEWTGYDEEFNDLDDLVFGEEDE
jgi:hypothetical protein